MADDEGERLARVEERLKVVEAELATWKRMIFGAVAVLVGVTWNKIAALIGMGPGQ